MCGFLLPEYNCTRCNPTMQKVRNCHKESDTVVNMGDDTYKRCPNLFNRDHPSAMAKLRGYWRMMDKGILPEAGGVEDQQNQVMAALAIFDNAVMEAKAALKPKR